MEQKTSIEECEPMIKSFEGEITLDKTIIYIEAILMDKCIIIWLGSQQRFDTLSFAIQTKYSNIPTSTNVLGCGKPDSFEQDLAARTASLLQKKCILNNKSEKPVWGCYASLNLNDDLLKIEDFEFILEKELRKKLLEWKLISE